MQTSDMESTAVLAQFNENLNRLREEKPEEYLKYVKEISTLAVEMNALLDEIA